MTTIITRLYADHATAHAVSAALVAGGLNEDAVTVITSPDKAAMRAARVHAGSAAKYAAAMTGGQALVVAEAGFNPVGAARKAIKIVGRTPSIDCGVADEDDYQREYVSSVYANSVMQGAPLMLTNKFARFSHGHILGSNPVIHSRPRTSAIRGGAFMSRFFWPMKRVSTSRSSTSAIRGGKLMSEMFGLSTLYRR
jgi:hypothetical protein